VTISSALPLEAACSVSHSRLSSISQLRGSVLHWPSK